MRYAGLQAHYLPIEMPTNVEMLKALEKGEADIAVNPIELTVETFRPVAFTLPVRREFFVYALMEHGLLQLFINESSEHPKNDNFLDHVFAPLVSLLVVLSVVGFSLFYCGLERRWNVVKYLWLATARFLKQTQDRALQSKLSTLV